MQSLRPHAHGCNANGIAAAEDLELHSGDVPTASINGDIDAEVYMKALDCVAYADESNCMHGKEVLAGGIC